LLLTEKLRRIVLTRLQPGGVRRPGAMGGPRTYGEALRSDAHYFRQSDARDENGKCGNQSAEELNHSSCDQGRSTLVWLQSIGADLKSVRHILCPFPDTMVMRPYNLAEIPSLSQVDFSVATTY
jgi:hypothetical protein